MSKGVDGQQKSTTDKNGCWFSSLLFIFETGSGRVWARTLGIQILRTAWLPSSTQFEICLFVLLQQVIYSFWLENISSVELIFLFSLFFSGQKAMYGLFFPMSKKCHIFVTDTVRSNQMPNLNVLYNTERNNKWDNLHQFQIYILLRNLFTFYVD